MQCQMMNMMMMSMMGSQSNRMNRQTDMKMDSVEDVKQDDKRKHAAKYNNGNDFGEGGAEC